MGGGIDAVPNRLEIRLTEPGIRTFACEKGDHCAAGQVVAVIITSNAPVQVDAGVKDAAKQSGEDSDASQGCQVEPRLIAIIATCSASLLWQYT